MTAALDRVGQRAAATPDRIGQATAVEQARAVAEVAAAVQVARQFPRDMERVIEDLEEACGDYELAREAFYAVQNRGDGPSVHLARELARIFGNFQYGVHELRRDDEAGESEVQAFAWDVERNTRSSRTFVNPHATMKKVGGVQTRVTIVDLDDIYRSNQNTGARAVREVIFSSLPKKVVRYAEELCRATLTRGKDGQSIEARRKEAVDAFARGSVAVAQLVKRVGKPVEQWTPQDVAGLEVLYGSLTHGEITRQEAFPEEAGGDGQERVTAGEIAGQGAAGTKATQGQLARIHALLHDYGVESDDGVREAIGLILQKPPASRTALTKVDADTVIASLEKGAPPAPPTAGSTAGDEQIGTAS